MIHDDLCLKLWNFVLLEQKEMAGAEILKLQSLTTAGSAPIDFTIERQLSGGTGPLLIRRASDGRQFVLKSPLYESGRDLIKRNAHEANEYLAFQLYRAAGVRIPDSVDLVKVVVEGKDVIGVLEDFIDGVTLNDLMNPRRGDPHVRELTFPAIRNDLVIHALFANWDINMPDNIMIARVTDANGKTTYDYSNPITIDCGGTLLFRAMGDFKDYGPVVRNVESIIIYAENENPMNVLKGLSKDALRAEICRRWATVNKRGIMDSFAATAGLVAPYFAAAGLSVERLGETLAARLAHFDALCGAGANKGGKRTRRRSSRRAGTRRVRR